MVFNEIVNFIMSTVGNMGYTGIVVLMFLESSFFPFPSEVVIPPAAYLASRGDMNLYLVIISGIVGSLLGAIFNYYLALYLGRPFFYKYGKYFFVSHNSLKKAEGFFEVHGHISTFVGRLLPGIRQYISLPAGLAKMNIWLFSIFTALGAGIWVIVLALLGYFFGINRELLKQHLHIVSISLIIFVLVVSFIYFWIYKRKNKVSGEDYENIGH
ncbi:DedA family protein [Desulfothermus okinawensis JCM 13304]